MSIPDFNIKDLTKLSAPATPAEAPIVLPAVPDVPAIDIHDAESFLHPSASIESIPAIPSMPDVKIPSLGPVKSDISSVSKASDILTSHIVSYTTSYVATQISALQKQIASVAAAIPLGVGIPAIASGLAESKLLDAAAKAKAKLMASVAGLPAPSFPSFPDTTSILSKPAPGTPTGSLLPLSGKSGTDVIAGWTDLGLWKYVTEVAISGSGRDSTNYLLTHQFDATEKLVAESLLMRHLQSISTSSADLSSLVGLPGNQVIEGWASGGFWNYVGEVALSGKGPDSTNYHKIHVFDSQEIILAQNLLTTYESKY